MNERTQFFGFAVVVGIVTMQVSPMMRGMPTRPPFVPTVLGGLAFGGLCCLVYPLILG